MLPQFISAFKVHFKTMSSFSYMCGWQQFLLSLPSRGGLLSSFNLPTYAILADAAALISCCTW